MYIHYNTTRRHHYGMSVERREPALRSSVMLAGIGACGESLRFSFSSFSSGIATAFGCRVSWSRSDEEEIGGASSS